MPSNWNNNNIQFPRLLAELNAMGTIRISKDLCESMDCTKAEIQEIIDRAEVAWDNIKNKKLGIKKIHH